MTQTNQVEPLRAVHVADLILVRHDGTELLHDRRIYMEPGAAKSMRTRWNSSVGRNIGMLGWWSQFAGYRAVAYTITPTGYQDLPFQKQVYYTSVLF